MSANHGGGKGEGELQDVTSLPKKSLTACCSNNQWKTKILKYKLKEQESRVDDNEKIMNVHFLSHYRATKNVWWNIRSVPRGKSNISYMSRLCLFNYIFQYCFCKFPVTDMEFLLCGCKVNILGKWLLDFWMKVFQKRFKKNKDYLKNNRSRTNFEGWFNGISIRTTLNVLY